MIDITTALYNIMHSRYGKDVRSSIHDSIYQINENANEALQNAKTMGVGTAVSSPTSSSTGYVAGNLYLNDSTWDLWQCIGTDAWVNKGNIKGAKGDSGNDGTNYYVYIRYSQYYDGTDFTVSPTASSQYIGIYSGTSATVPTNKADYTWATFVGAAGTSSYVHIMYSEQADGSNFVNVPTANCKYIGIYSGSLSSPPANKSYYTWSEYVGKTGTGTGDMLKSEFAGKGVVGTVDKATELVDVTNSKTADTVLLANLTDDAGQLKYKGNNIGSEYITSVSSDFDVTSKKLSLASTVSAKLSSVDDSADWLKPIEINVTMEQGSTTTSGVPIEATTVCRNIIYRQVIQGGKYVVKTDASNIDLAVSYFADNLNSERIGFSGWSSKELGFTVPSGCNYIQIIARHPSYTTITPTECGNVVFYKYNKSNTEITETLANSEDWINRNLYVDSIAYQEASNNVMMPINVEPNTTYIMGADNSDLMTATYEYDASGNRTLTNNWSASNPLTFTTLSTTIKVEAYYGKTGLVAISKSDIKCPRLMKGTVLPKSNTELTNELSVVDVTDKFTKDSTTSSFVAYKYGKIVCFNAFSSNPSGKFNITIDDDSVKPAFGFQAYGICYNDWTSSGQATTVITIIQNAILETSDRSYTYSSVSGFYICK